MEQKHVVTNSLIAVGIFAAVIICVGMASGFTMTNSFVTPGSLSNQNTGSLSEEKYIRVDPVGDRTVGDIFTVTGTTNLPAGTNLLVEIMPATFEPEGGVNGEFAGAAGGVDVLAGTGGINTWSMEVNSSTLNPVKMLVNVSVFTGDVKKSDFSTSGPIGTREFTLHPPAAGNAAASQPAGAVTFATIGDRKTGGQFTITGTTNLPAGTNLFWEILPDSGVTPTGVDLDAPIGIMANNQVTAGTGSSNRIALDVNMTDMKPGKYVVTVSSLAGDPMTVSPATGVLAGYTYFNLK